MLASKASVMDGDGQISPPRGLPSRISWPPSGGASPLDFTPREQGSVWPWPQATCPLSVHLPLQTGPGQAVCVLSDFWPFSLFAGSRVQLTVPSLPWQPQVLTPVI